MSPCRSTALYFAAKQRDDDAIFREILRLHKTLREATIVIGYGKGPPSTYQLRVVRFTGKSVRETGYEYTVKFDTISSPECGS